MSIEIVKYEERDKWNAIVKSFSHYDVYYLNEYTSAFYLHNDGIPELIYYKDENIKAINVVMKREIMINLNQENKEKYYDYTTPYGYGGFLLEGKNIEDSINSLRKEYQDFCKRNNIVTEFVRFHPVLKNRIGLDEIYDITDLGDTITIPLISKEYIWNNLNGKNRNVIRKAQKNNVKIFWGRNEELYNTFIDMYNKTMDKDNATNYYYFNTEFYSSILYDLKDNATLFYAEYEGEIIAMSIIMHCNQSLHYHLSASKQEFQKLAPTNLLLYEAACWGVENGFKSFHLGGGLGSKKDSLYKFKESFVKEHDYTYFSIGRKIFDENIYFQLCEITNTESEELYFFPKYRYQRKEGD